MASKSNGNKTKPKSKPAPSKRPIKRNEHGQIEQGSGPLNPAGRPSEGESWQGVFRRVFEMSLDEAAAYAGEIGKRIKKYGKGTMTGKELIAFRVLDALAFEPQASLLSAVMERAEGKIAQPIAQMSWREYLEQNGISSGEAFERMVASAADAARTVRADDGGRGSSGGASSTTG